MQHKKLIVNARLVNEGSVKEGDLLIEGQHIEKIGDSLSASNDTEVIDASGRLLIPGLIDDQVHFREPGMTQKGTIASESRAAVAGGITSYLDMPNNNPATTTLQAIAKKNQIAALHSAGNYGFYLGATNNNLEDIKSIDPVTVCGVKVFMGSSTGSLLVDQESSLEGIFAHSPVQIVTHCEDNATILHNQNQAAIKYNDNIPVFAHPSIRSRQACLLSTTHAVNLAKRYGSRLHVLHITTADELQLFDAGPVNAKKITGEVCAHHLFFNNTWYAEKGNLIKCNPAIKSIHDQIALQNAICTDVLDVIATDHAPHTLKEKNLPYMQAPAGLPLVQHVLQALLELCNNGYFDLPKIISKFCHAPADLFKIESRGYLREGYFADLVLVDDSTSYVVDDEQLHYKCAWTPFAGSTFNSSIDATWVNGHMVWDKGKHLPSPPGMNLTYARQNST